MIQSILFPETIGSIEAFDPVKTKMTVLDLVEKYMKDEIKAFEAEKT